MTSPCEFLPLSLAVRLIFDGKPNDGMSHVFVGVLKQKIEVTSSDAKGVV